MIQLVKVGLADDLAGAGVDGVHAGVAGGNADTLNLSVHLAEVSGTDDTAAAEHLEDGAVFPLDVVRRAVRIEVGDGDVVGSVIAAGVVGIALGPRGQHAVFAVPGLADQVAPLVLTLCHGILEPAVEDEAAFGIKEGDPCLQVPVVLDDAVGKAVGTGDVVAVPVPVLFAELQLVSGLLVECLVGLEELTVHAVVTGFLVILGPVGALLPGIAFGAEDAVPFGVRVLALQDDPLDGDLLGQALIPLHGVDGLTLFVKVGGGEHEAAVPVGVADLGIAKVCGDDGIALTVQVCEALYGSGAVIGLPGLQVGGDLGAGQGDNKEQGDAECECEEKSFHEIHPLGCQPAGAGRKL